VAYRIKIKGTSSSFLKEPPNLIFSWFNNVTQVCLKTHISEENRRVYIMTLKKKDEKTRLCGSSIVQQNIKVGKKKKEKGGGETGRKGTKFFSVFVCVDFFLKNAVYIFVEYNTMTTKASLYLFL
jgi:hypothetical protein